MSKVLRPEPGAGTVYQQRSPYEGAAFVAACCAVAFGLGLVVVAILSAGQGRSSAFIQVATLDPPFAAATDAPAPPVIEGDAAAEPEVAVAALSQDEAPVPAEDTPREVAGATVSAAAPSGGQVTGTAASSLTGRSVWSNGDSTSYFMSIWLLGAMEQLGAIPVHEPEYRESSGLLSRGLFDWSGYIREQMATFDPEIVVFMVGTDDLDPAMDLDAYTGIVGAQMDAFQGREVYWVGVPSFDPDLRPDLVSMTGPVNELFQAEAAKRAWVTYVDVTGVTTDEDGNYAQVLPTASGEPGTLRSPDGIHFTSAGGRVVAEQVLAAMQSR